MPRPARPGHRPRHGGTPAASRRGRHRQPLLATLRVNAPACLQPAKKEKPCFALLALPPQSSVGQWCTQQASKQAPLIQAQPASASSASVTRCGIGIVRDSGHILAPHPATLQIDQVDRHGSGGQSHPRRRRGHHGRRSGGGAARRRGWEAPARGTPAAAAPPATTPGPPSKSSSRATP